MPEVSYSGPINIRHHHINHDRSEITGESGTFQLFR